MAKKITYDGAGVQYGVLDPVKKMAQEQAVRTAGNLNRHGFSEVPESRGESAYVWKMGNVYMASVVEGLGTKNLVADGMDGVSRKSYYDVIGYDTVATIINDLASVGAAPLVIHAYWASGTSDIFGDRQKMGDLIKGWTTACDDSGASWGGGETPTLTNIIEKNVLDLGGSAVGIVKSKNRLITDSKLRAGDRIILLRSSGVNANGISLARAIVKQLPKGYATRMPNGKLYGEALLTKTHIYARLVQSLLDAGVDIHYISNITGHGMRKVMRARPSFTYVIEKVFRPQEIFAFIAKQAGLSDGEMYATYNMGQDFAIFIPEKEIEKTLDIVSENKFKALNAGYVEKGEKQVVIKPRDIVYKAGTLDLR